MNPFKSFTTALLEPDEGRFDDLFAFMCASGLECEVVDVHYLSGSTMKGLLTDVSNLLEAASSGLFQDQLCFILFEPLTDAAPQAAVLNIHRMMLIESIAARSANEEDPEGVFRFRRADGSWIVVEFRPIP